MSNSSSKSEDILLQNLDRILDWGIISQVRSAIELEKQEAIALAVVNALIGAQAEIAQLRQEKSRLSEAYEERAAESSVDETGAFRKGHFERILLPNYVRLLCTNRRNLNRRSLWPVLHFFDGRKFGRYNKIWNQITGDKILAKSAQTFLGAVRSSDLMGRQYDYVAHVGGDEFAILQTDMDTYTEAYDSPQRFIKAISEANWAEIKQALAEHPPLFDVGSVCVREDSLRIRTKDGVVTRLPDEEIELIASSWYVQAAEALLEAKEMQQLGISSSVIRFVEWDRDRKEFAPVPEEEARPKQELRHLEL